MQKSLQMAQIMGSVNNVQLLPEREGPGKNGYKPVEVGPTSTPVVVEVVVRDEPTGDEGGRPPLELEPGPKEGRVQVTDVRKSTVAASTAAAQPAGGMVRREGFLPRMTRQSGKGTGFRPCCILQGESGVVHESSRSTIPQAERAGSRGGGVPKPG